jgi:predicted component of type VI protein secretion system
MVLELRVAGPGLDVVRRLQAGEPRMVLGRDAECDLVLPDPERNVSRRHLAVWVEGGELHFHVLSVVNGIEMPFGEAPPGARGVLVVGQSLKVGDYELTIAPGDESPARDTDPWAVLDREAGAPPAAVRTGGFKVPAPEDDPFGDWGFATTFTGSLDAEGLTVGDISSFYRGLGLEAGPSAFTRAELEAAGRLVRLLVLGMLDLHSSVAQARKDLQPHDRTDSAPPDNNPLVANAAPEAKLRYLFGGRLAAAGKPSPERALRELLVDLIAHDAASGAAARAALQATLEEFAPAALKDHLLGPGTRLFEGARAWEAYGRLYDEQAADMAAWTQRLLDRYFAEAYFRESLRIRRETPSRDQ